MNKNILEISPWIRAEDIVVFGDPHGQIDAVKELITSF